MAKTEWVTLDVEGNPPMKAFLAKPDKPGNYPGIIVFVEIFGVNQHIQEVTSRIAEEGYIAMAPNFYHRQAPDLNLGYTPEDIQIGRQYKTEVTHQDLLADAEASIRYLHNLPECDPKDKLGTIGFCFGGYVAYLAATLPEVVVTVSLYGSGIVENALIDLTGKIHGYVFCGYGEKDSSISAENIAAIDHALEKAHVPHQIITYAGADHGFFCDRRASYNPQAASQVWEEIKDLFASHLKANVSCTAL